MEVTAGATCACSLNGAAGESRADATGGVPRVSPGRRPLGAGILFQRKHRLVHVEVVRRSW